MLQGCFVIQLVSKVFLIYNKKEEEISDEEVFLNAS